MQKLQIKKSDLKENKPVLVEVQNKKVMLVMINGTAYAIDAVCSHRGGPLYEGKLSGYSIECPWHGAIYDVRTGAGDPSTSWGKGQSSYKVSVDDATGEISLDI